MKTSETPLRKVRRSRGLTLDEVATAINWDTGNLSRAERTGCKSIERAAQLAKFFKGGINEIEILYPERFLKRR